MLKFRLSFLVLSVAAWGLAGSYNDVPHFDHRGTPHLQFNPAYAQKAGLAGADLARDFLRQNASVYGLPNDLGNLTLFQEKTSLLATHYHFQQDIDGLKVIGGEIVVSIAHETKQVSRVYNNIFPVGDRAAVPAVVSLDEDDAYDIAWSDLAVHGELMDAPKAELVYVPQGKNFDLVWQVYLGVQAPFGYWQVRVDANSGRVMKVEEISLSRKAIAGVPEKYAGQIDDRLASFARYNQREALRSAERQALAAKARLADGTANVFDPDPRTTLNTEALADNSPASSFTAAYINRNLTGLEQSGGLYRLNGPWVSIIDFESPATAPSTTANGNWTAVRGNNAFNDTMTYFHLHQNQAYIQSLGFTGPTGIQELSIGADSDGLNGDDNSHFIPGSNRIAFGHGCVDDNEDADVILHEYGHAIHYGINSNWGGGDSGAIGEGFGDYWAGSYSFSTANGPIFHPNWVFTWDGHSACWPGRDMDKTSLMYDPNSTYGAHQSIPGGQTDELWSTPIFQAHQDLRGMSVPRSEIDQIVLESHFGLGSGVTMRVLGNATVAAAGQLQPGGPHAGVFTTRFLAQNIIDIPHVAMAANSGSITGETGENGAADPGETVQLKLLVENMGNLAASAVTGTLTSNDPNVTIQQGASAYPDLGVGQSGVNTTDFSISLDPNMTCGDTFELSLQVDWTDTSRAPGSTTLTFTLPTGVGLGYEQGVSPALAIPDNTTVTSNIVIAGTGATVTANLNIDVDISHSYVGDLAVTLRAPDGTTVLLHNHTGGSAHDIVGNYPQTLTPAQSLSALVGKAADGTWQLEITDTANGDTGTLNAWTIHDITGFECEDALPFCLGDLNGDRQVDTGDLAIALEGWTTVTGDANASGLTNIIDLLDIMDAYGNCDAN